MKRRRIQEKFAKKVGRQNVSLIEESKRDITRTSAATKTKTEHINNCSWKETILEIDPSQISLQSSLQIDKPLQRARHTRADIMTDTDKVHSHLQSHLESPISAASQLTQFRSSLPRSFAVISFPRRA